MDINHQHRLEKCPHDTGDEYGVYGSICKDVLDCLKPACSLL